MSDGCGWVMIMIMNENIDKLVEFYDVWDGCGLLLLLWMCWMSGVTVIMNGIELVTIVLMTSIIHPQRYGTADTQNYTAIQSPRS